MHSGTALLKITVSGNWLSQRRSANLVLLSGAKPQEPDGRRSSGRGVGAGTKSCGCLQSHTY